MKVPRYPPRQMCKMGSDGTSLYNSNSSSTGDHARLLGASLLDVHHWNIYTTPRQKTSPQLEVPMARCCIIYWYSNSISCQTPSSFRIDGRYPAFTMPSYHFNALRRACRSCLLHLLLNGAMCRWGQHPVMSNSKVPCWQAVESINPLPRLARSSFSVHPDSRCS